MDIKVEERQETSALEKTAIFLLVSHTTLLLVSFFRLSVLAEMHAILLLKQQVLDEEGKCTAHNKSNSILPLHCIPQGC